MRAWANGERRTAACVILETQILQVLRGAGNEPRILDLPDRFSDQTSSSSSHPELAGRFLDCEDDVLVAGAAAEIAFELVTDSLVRELSALADEVTTAT